MRTIGLLGGMSWESSLEYYRLVNTAVRDRLGGTHSAACVLYSFDFAEIEALQEAGDWDGAARTLTRAAHSLAAAGAEILVLCTNTMHRVAPEVEAGAPIPLLHIADPTGEAATQQGISTVGLLGTRYTMEGSFYRGRLEDAYGLSVIIPEEADRDTVHRVIFDELVRGEVRDSSRRAYREVIARLVTEGAEAVILGCTEIELLVGAEDASVSLYPTTRLHAAAAVDAALTS